MGLEPGICYVGYITELYLNTHTYFTHISRSCNPLFLKLKKKNLITYKHKNKTFQLSLTFFEKNSQQFGFLFKNPDILHVTVLQLLL